MLRLSGNAPVLFTIGLLLVSSTPPASATGERLAVLIVADDDAQLSDNLTEVAISKLAERRDHRLVGWRELHDRLPEIFHGHGVADCLDQPRCLASIGAAARADSALIGDVRRQVDRFIVRLVLLNTNTGVHDAEFSESAPGDIANLIAVVRRGASVVSTPKPATLALQPARAQAVLHTEPSPGPAMVSVQHPAPHRTRWTAPLAYAAGGVAVVTLSAAVVTGSLATAQPSGATRAEAQSDLDRRNRYAEIANGLYVAGGVLAVTAAIALLSQLLHHGGGGS